MGDLFTYSFPREKRIKEKTILANFHRSGNPLYPAVRAIKLSCCLSVKDVNTGKVFIFDQTATEELKTLTPTRVTGSVTGQGRDKEGLF